jgi:hypothetical protein
MLARTQKFIESHQFNRTLDRLLFVGGAMALATSLVLATASLFVA